jgi:hypothetical protein
VSAIEVQGVRLPWFARFRVDLPAAQRGPWRIVIDRVAAWKEEGPRLGEIWGGVRVPQLSWPGEYRVLERFERSRVTMPVEAMPELADDEAKDFDGDGNVTYDRWKWKTWMADSPVEIATQLDAVRRLHGHVLIGGLGLGVLVKAALARRDVESVTVLEIDADIIAMVAPHYRDRRLRVLHADAMEYRPRGKRWYDVVYMDIWRDVGMTNLIDMLRLRRRWIDRCGWYGAWSEDRAIDQLRSGDHDFDDEIVTAALGRFRNWGACA